MRFIISGIMARMPFSPTMPSRAERILPTVPLIFDAHPLAVLSLNTDGILTSTSPSMLSPCWSLPNIFSMLSVLIVIPFSVLRSSTAVLIFLMVEVMFFTVLADVESSSLRPFVLSPVTGLFRLICRISVKALNTATAC